MVSAVGQSVATRACMLSFTTAAAAAAPRPRPQQQE